MGGGLLKKKFRFAASSVLLATYEHQVTQKDDPLVEANEFTEQLLVKPGAPGTTAVDLFPPRELYYAFSYSSPCEGDIYIYSTEVVSKVDTFFFTWWIVEETCG